MKSDSRPNLRARLNGILLPITTPFLPDGSLDFPGLRANIGKWNETGVSGYVVLGSTGERVHLDENEIVETIKTARDSVSESKLFIAGCGQQSTLGTVNEIKRIAKAVSVDAVLVLTPHFYRAAITQDALIRHYQQVADESPVPVLLYSMPALTGIKIEAETTARLSEHENIIGLKDSSNDVAGLQETVRQVDEEFAVLTGNGTVLKPALLAGASGAILAVGCAAPALCIAILDAIRSGVGERAAKLQSSLTPLAAAVTTSFGIGGLKAALEMIGYSGGGVRAPLRMPDAEARKEIRRCLEDAQNVLQDCSAPAPLSA
jgi:dihydrodipicolinate synthase/N-acetylneuraminate lyase